MLEVKWLCCVCVSVVYVRVFALHCAVHCCAPRIHSFIHSLIHSFTHSLIHSFIHMSPWIVSQGGSACGCVARALVARECARVQRALCVLWCMW